jgi:hypothetical protein
MGLFTKEAKHYMIDERQLICMFCKHDSFYTRQEQLHSPTRTILNLEWTDSTATCFVCSNCGYMHWFNR